MTRKKADPRIREYIAGVMSEPASDGMSQKQIQREADDRLKRDGLGHLAGSRSYKQREIKKIKAGQAERAGRWEDVPWSMGYLADSRISLDRNALSAIESVDRLAKIGRQPFTVRMALWTARLQVLIPLGTPAFWRVWFLYSFAGLMAREEITARLLQRSLNSTALQSLGSFHGLSFLQPNATSAFWMTSVSRLARELNYAPPTPIWTAQSTEMSDDQYHPSLPRTPLDVIEPESEWLVGILESKCLRKHGRYIENLDQIGYEAVLLALRSLEEAERFKGAGLTDRDPIGQQLCEAALHKEHDQFQEVLQRETLIAENLIKEATDGD